MTGQTFLQALGGIVILNLSNHKGVVSGNLFVRHGNVGLRRFGLLVLEGKAYKKFIEGFPAAVKRLDRVTALQLFDAEGDHLILPRSKTLGSLRSLPGAGQRGEERPKPSGRQSTVRRSTRNGGDLARSPRRARGRSPVRIRSRIGVRQGQRFVTRASPMMSAGDQAFHCASRCSAWVFLPALWPLHYNTSARHCHDKIGRPRKRCLPLIIKIKARADNAGTGEPSERLILARQIDHVVREAERDFVEREIRVLDLLRVDDVVVAVVAGERGCPVCA